MRSGDRTTELRSVTAPTLVIHGDHDLPSQVWPRVAGLIDSHIRVADPDQAIRGSGDGQES
jgi:pimeloyl-ACP methyl ester carboxylesterase